jgi:hypothetical protein
VRRDGEAVRLFLRRGHDWTDRYPAIASAAAKLKARSFTLDGEAVVCDPDGLAVFDALHRRGRAPGQIGPAAAPSSRPHAVPQCPTVLSGVRCDLVAESSHLSSFLLGAMMSVVQGKAPPKRGPLVLP